MTVDEDKEVADIIQLDFKAGEYVHRIGEEVVLGSVEDNPLILKVY